MKIQAYVNYFPLGKPCLLELLPEKKYAVSAKER